MRKEIQLDLIDKPKNKRGGYRGTQGRKKGYPTKVIRVKEHYLNEVKILLSLLEAEENKFGRSVLLNYRNHLTDKRMILEMKTKIRE